jgi:hypothetical protein
VVGNDLNEDGDLYIWPENQPAVTLWLLIGDQWRRAGMDGIPVAFDMGVALEYAREMARMDSSLQVLPLTQRIRFIATCVLTAMRERQR